MSKTFSATFSLPFAGRHNIAAGACIGVFDSGVGGLSVLRALRARLPTESFRYIGDAAWAPYGNRRPTEVMARCELIVDHLLGAGATLIVVACNTASVQAIGHLRDRWPGVPFVGVEPGIKPAALLTRSGRIAVMATVGTIASARLRQLVELHASQSFVHLQACPGLAEAIEGGLLENAALEEALAACCTPIRAADVDTVVLGCTHYPFVADRVQRLLGPGVRLLDTAAAVAARVAALRPVPGSSAPATTQMFSTGSTLPLRRLLRQCPGLQVDDRDVATIDL